MHERFSQVSPVSFALLLSGVLAPALPAQQTAVAGPVIHSAGAVFEIEHPDVPTPAHLEYKLAFEMVRAAESPDRLNVVLNSVARYLNMHAQAGVPEERLDAAVVVHGPSGWELLDHAGYRERHGVDNPNAELISELAKVGVRVILCGQTAASRGIPREGLLPEVDVALSAMTAFMVLQEEGFRVNPW